MSWMELGLIGIGLGMDAFAVSICKGLSMSKFHIKKALMVALWFGIFQALMPAFGYALGNTFASMLASFDHLLAFFILTWIGKNMIQEAKQKKSQRTVADSLSIHTMLPLAIATSIDAFTVGVTFAFLEVEWVVAISIIGIITFCMCFFGVIFGYRFGHHYEKEVQMLGGFLLLGLGIKSLWEYIASF